MLVNTTQAKEKWCPMVRRIDSGVAQNVFGDANCIGSDCMMWRWVNLSTSEGSPLGYCGLAGHWSAAK